MLPPPSCWTVLAIINVYLTVFVHIQTLNKAIFYWIILLCSYSFVSWTELNTITTNFPMQEHKLPYTMFIFPSQQCHSTCQNHLNYEFYQPSPSPCSQNSFSFTLVPLMDLSLMLSPGDSSHGCNHWNATTKSHTSCLILELLMLVHTRIDSNFFDDFSLPMNHFHQYHIIVWGQRSTWPEHLFLINK